MDRITEFVDSFIPKTLPKKRQKQLKDELYCHLLDKADYYRELGFEKKISFDKAVEDFGTDADMKNYILGEFEELYKERTIWGILAAVFIWALNILCYPLDLWSYSADFNRDPDPLGAFMSFLMIFSVLGLVVFARVKKYRKMLFFIGLSNTTITAGFLWCLYPQMAAYSMWYNIIYLIDRFTPFISYDTVVSVIMLWIIWVGIPAVLSLYPLIASLLLKLGRLSDVKNPRKKCIITAVVCFTVMFTTCMLQRTGFEYSDEYPVFFSPYNIYISEETEDIYNRINIGCTVEEAEEIMDEYAIQSVEKYRGFLDKLGKKQLDKKLREMDFDEKYKVYFPPYSYIKGEGFVGITEENGIVTGVAVGNIDDSMFNEKARTFGYTDTGTWKGWDNMGEALIYLGTLKGGDREEDILVNFGDDFGLLGEDTGMIYSKRKHLENGSLKTCYRVYFYGITDPEKKLDYERFSPYYAELFFTDGALEKGSLYTREYDEDGIVPKKVMTIG